MSTGTTLSVVQWTDNQQALQAPGSAGIAARTDAGGADPVLFDSFTWSTLGRANSIFSLGGPSMGQIVGNNTNSVNQMLLAYKTYLTTGAWHLRLYQNNTAPNPNMDVTQFTEATFTGYAAKTGMTWAVGPYYTTAGFAELLDALYTWTPTGTTTSNIVYGWYLTDVSGAWVIGEAFTTPMPMGSLTNVIALVLKLGLSTLGISGDVQPEM
jgi:hypothetical protein